MIDKINALPKPLKIVCWLQLILAAISLVLAIVSITESTGSKAISNVINIVLPILVILGIIQASKFIRMFVLILTWVSVLIYGFLMIAIVATMNLGVIVLIIPLAIGCITIWGLSHREAKEYFGV